ncbi:hypothetical protein ACGFZU_06560 [Streptomyces tendae]|uniref:hypothetical protein n=1 Tax=Streptomyces tendae TaxID=1932 RepID=UPI003720E25B
MARLQILELPTGADDDRPPFVLVIDQVESDVLLRDLGDHRDLIERSGARAVLVFEDTIDIPANDTSGGIRDGVHWASPDELRAQIQEAIAKAHTETIKTANEDGRITTDEQKGQPSTKPRRDWCCSLAFQTLGKQHIDDCRQDNPQP